MPPVAGPTEADPPTSMSGANGLEAGISAAPDLGLRRVEQLARLGVERGLVRERDRCDVHRGDVKRRRLIQSGEPVRADQLQPGRLCGCEPAALTVAAPVPTERSREVVDAEAGRKRRYRRGLHERTV